VIYLILSDLHLGKGKFLKNGQLNILEDFFEDDRFEEFLRYYSTGEYALKPVHLVLNGDILNLIQIDHQGVFSHIVDSTLTIEAIKDVMKGHPVFFEALKRFCATPGKRLTYIIGNHDAAMAFEEAQVFLKEAIGGEVDVSFELDDLGVYIEHGHKYEVINTVPEKKYFLEGPNGKKILNLPWGSLFCIHVLPKLRKERPFIDKVRPLNAYIRWIFFHDFFFFVKLTVIVLRYLISTKRDIYVRQNRNFKTTLKLLKQITIYPNYERKARSLLKRKKHIHTVVMGHTHVGEWRRFPEGKYYFNTGTWNEIPSMDAGLHESNPHLSYCLLDVHDKSSTLRAGSLNRWQGEWKPYLSEVST
jgi:UDP-2,3-diacylglucosamine pyrophosphatase LpxH